MKNYTATDDRYKRQGDVQTDDATIRERLAKLPTLIEMPYNQIVRSYIDRYTQRGRAQVAALLGLNLYYMPIFEQALEQNGLPLELKYLPVIESGLDPNAVSKHGASGLWQFMIGTAKGMGLEVSSLVDERRDPVRSSEAATKYLRQLHDIYNDWSLAIAAYNCGPGNVNKALRRCEGEKKRFLDNLSIPAGGNTRICAMLHRRELCDELLQQTQHIPRPGKTAHIDRLRARQTANPFPTDCRRAPYPGRRNSDS